FLHTHSTVLKSVFIEIYVIIVVVGVGKELILDGKNVGGGYVDLGEEKTFRAGNLHEFTAFVSEVFPLLVTQVGVHIAVANDLEGALDPDRAMVSGQDDLRLVLGDLPEGVEQWRVKEPRLGQRTVGRPVGGEL